MNNTPDFEGRLSRAVRRAAFAAVACLAGINGALLDTGIGDVPEFLFGALLGIAAVLGAYALVRLGARLLGHLPGDTAAALAAALLAMFALDAYPPGTVLRTLAAPDDWAAPAAHPHALTVPALFLLVLTVALIAGLVALRRRSDVPATRRVRVAAAAAVLLTAASAVSVWSLVRPGTDPWPTTYRLEPEAATAGLPNPAAPGVYPVVSLSYGAGENARRPEYGPDRDLDSRTVDASALLPEWRGVKQRMRERYWGFGLEAAPLNGLVWAPEGDGPWPLVLIVHGNHGMEDYSDAGYAYLGELLASRGYIAVSVDQNYINGSWSGDFRGKEMALRAWLLLEHLRLWRDWQATAGHRFEGRVDLSRIALVGHSRGGEAVSIAYAFNELPWFPDDATVRFDYGFSIRALVAIAQVDQRYHRRVELDDVSFLTLQGSYDADEPAWHGLRQWNRIRLDGGRHFKAGLYVHRANHGQFNSTWGRYDYGPPEAWLLNVAPLIAPEDQQAVARAYLSAFLHAALGDDRRYLALFRDPRAGAAWLPPLAYVHRYTDWTYTAVAGFDEDLDVTSATLAGARIAAEGFEVWREEELRHRDERRQGTSAVVLGWRDDEPGRYRIELPDGLPAGDRLTFAISGSTETVDDEEESAAEPRAPDVTVELVDSGGRRAARRASDYASLAPPLRVQYLKPAGLNDKRYNDAWEPVLQHVEIPLPAFGAGIDAGAVRRLEFRFDGPGSVVILDDIGVLGTPGGDRGGEP